jgi:Uma2 family endonuclease
MDTILDPILRSPRMMAHIEELTRIRDEEKRKREQFWNETSPDEKAEFIRGEVIVHSPARAAHIAVTGRALTLLNTYVRAHGLGLVTSEKALVSLSRNDFEPDVCFFGVEKAAGIESDTWKFPAPDLAVEVLSDSTEERDRGVKLEDYAAHGVDEYWIVDPIGQTLEQYLLAGQDYVLALKVRDGHVPSRAVAGFTLPVRALFDDSENLAALRDILSHG